jgi:hypothetical protein
VLPALLCLVLERRLVEWGQHCNHVAGRKEKLLLILLCVLLLHLMSGLRPKLTCIGAKLVETWRHVYLLFRRDGYQG